MGCADPAGFHVNVEYPFQSLSPTHRHVSLRGCFLILIRCQFWAALAPPGRGHPHPVQAIRSKDTAESGQVDPGPGYQGGQFGNEIHRLEDHMGRAITIRGFQFIANPTLIGVMNRIRDEFAVSNTVTPQFVGDDFPWFTFVFLQHSIEKSLSSFSISPFLEKHINDFTILIDRPPKIVLLAINLDEHFINEKCITISLMPSAQPGFIFRSKPVAPQSGLFMSDIDSTVSQ